MSRKPWGELLNRALKLFTVNAAAEGGRSLGRLVFFVLLGALALVGATCLLEAATGWVSGLFDFWPFGGTPDEAGEPGPGWLGRLLPFGGTGKVPCPPRRRARPFSHPLKKPGRRRRGRSPGIAGSIRSTEVAGVSRRAGRLRRDPALKGSERTAMRAAEG